MAVTDKSKGHKGISAFMVERDRLGVSIGKEEEKMGAHLSGTAEVIFDNVIVPKENMIGAGRAGPYQLPMKIP